MFHQIKANYHTHTYRCKHATGDVADYVEAALAANLHVLGMCDHTPLPDNRWPRMRMDISELDDYVDAIEKAQQSYSEIKILKGMECDYSNEYRNFFADELLSKRRFDYLIASSHFYPHNGEWKSSWSGVKDKQDLFSYMKYLVDSISTGLFDLVGHPDGFAASYHAWDKDAVACTKYFLEAAEALKTPLEINSYGFRKGKITTEEGSRHQYPLEGFWEIASRYNISVIISSDAHTPEDTVSGLDAAYYIAEKYNLKIIDLKTKTAPGA